MGRNVGTATIVAVCMDALQIEELKLGDEILPVSPTALRGRMIYHEGKLLWLPKGLGDIFRIRKPFSKPLVFPILKELVKPKSDIEDESLYSFVQRRFNDEVCLSRRESHT